MYEGCLSEAERILAASKEVVVPVKTVWHEVLKHSRQLRFEVPSIGDFTAMLEADARFEFLPAHESVTETVSLPHDEHDVEENELESLGFFGEDRVKLRRIKFASDLDVEESETEAEDELAAISPTSANLKKRSGTHRAAASRKTKVPAKSHPRNGISRSRRKQPRVKPLRKSR